MLRKKIKINSRQRRHKRVRAKIFGTAKCPRLSVFRSNKYIYLQIIDDEKKKTIFSASDFELESKGKGKTKIIKTDKAYQAGELLAKKALKSKIKKVVFDRGGYKYHGRIKAAAEGARKAGLQF